MSFQTSLKLAMALKLGVTVEDILDVDVRWDNGNPVTDVRGVITDEHGAADEHVGVHPDEAAHALKGWLDGFGVHRRTLVSDNNGFDAI